MPKIVKKLKDRKPFTPSKSFVIHCLSLGIWLTKEGVKIHYKKLSNSHLINTVKYIKKQNINSLLLEKECKCCFGMGNKWLPILEQEIIYRDLTHLL